MDNGNAAKASEPEVEIQATSTAIAPASSGGSLDELTKLKDLFQTGLLTKEKFRAAKAKLLGL